MSEALYIGFFQNYYSHILTSFLFISKSDRNIGFISDEHLSFCDQISALSIITFVLSAVSVHTLTFTPPKQLPPLSYTPGLTTSCNSLYHGLPKYQINRLQHIQNALARTVVQAPKFQHVTPHWTNWIIKSSLTYKILNTTQPLYLYDLVSIQPPHGHNTRSSPYVTLIKPSSSLSHSSILPICFTSSLEPTYYITQNSSSKLHIPSLRPSFEHAGLTCYTLLSPFITFSLFHSELKTVEKILSSILVCSCQSDWSRGSRPFTGLICSSVLCFSSIFLFLLFLSVAD